MTHYIAHQQALIKNNICIVVLAFPEHDQNLMEETFSKFDYDTVVNLCEIQKEASIGSVWDGENFNVQYFQSWTLGEDLKWHPPIPKPDDNFYWNEDLQVWVENLGQTSI